MAGVGAGFTTSDPWLPVGPDADQVNVTVQQADTESTLGLYRRLIQARSTTHPVGAHNVQRVGPDLLVVRQDTAAGTRITVLNFATTPSSVPTETCADSNTSWLVLSTDRSRSSINGGGSSLQLGPLEGVIINTDRSNTNPATSSTEGAQP